MKNYIIGFVAVVALVIGVIGVSKQPVVKQGSQGQQGVQGIKGDRGSQGVQGVQGVKGDKGASGAIGLPGQLGAVAGLDHYSPERFWAGFSGNVLATSTSGSATVLREKDLFDNSVIELTSNVSAFTYTLPATSTLTSLLKNKGDTQTWVIKNATTTVATSITLAKGTGWDLTGVDANVDVIAGAAVGSEVYMRVSCVRQSNKDIACFLTENIAAD